MESNSKKYSAPALEKGLDILELLSKDNSVLNKVSVAERLGRSSAEIYRMLLVLEERGYIEKDEEAEGYRISRKLLQLGTEQEPIKELLEFSAPIMRNLCLETTMSCHIAVQSNEQLVVISRSEAPSVLSYSVRVGYRKPLIETASGRVLFAYQESVIKERWLDMFSKENSEDEIKSFIADSKKIAKQGYWKGPSSFVEGVTDLSAPILDGDTAIATLSVPHIQRRPEEVSVKKCIELLQSASEKISKAITLGIVKTF
ncbi:IclR family transcriptional regulator [Catenovulum agarivorans DS-2]|uniref:IclR family transcriptional regulator n=1 Tax=Catenovulum agarivorans DS-2 TaxID=1328313 RepID=W7QJ99_9ALTE|nr:IclR family transcriptional regulator [Catenovulum agarivorans]EWH11956.1 IclR family transcriptional regulator [Catenovulum agarivorans DS-2]